ncbi:MAG: orotidine 5'-phosphate decarboxylase [Candidatus Bathyarchaeia archaeon]|jgi:orotidine-5'-phosphate decarboxylase|nr:orotidine 5'-phosphate decarboxylase [Candidatus Bathyarchaeota archaeon A05DMB-4]MDH7595720.1 orotidine 5'-phosphate decarboxylase [Candidatus Bathyarchaeota archaeon]
MAFKAKMERSAKKKGSNIILALDLEARSTRTLLLQSIKLLETVHPYVCAVKLNHHLILPLGLFDGVQKILKKTIAYELPTIMDCKINDIGNTNRVIAENYYNAGFDAVIANPFVGWEEGLEPVFEIAQQKKRGVILLCYMSHKASWEGYGQIVKKDDKKQLPQYVAFAQKALEWNADGVVVGATYPEKIKEVHKILNDKVPIYSPGVGTQGGVVQSTVEAGARYLIVGRTIINAPNPEKAAKQLRDTVNRVKQ